MKLRLTKQLMAAVMACVACYGTAQATDTIFTTPSVSGTTYTWTGGAGTANPATAGNWGLQTMPGENSGWFVFGQSVDCGTNALEVETVSTGIKVSGTEGTGSTVTLKSNKWIGGLIVDSGCTLNLTMGSNNDGTACFKTEADNTTANVYVAGNLNVTDFHMCINGWSSQNQKWVVADGGSLSFSGSELQFRGASATPDKTWDIQLHTDASSGRTGTLTNLTFKNAADFETFTGATYCNLSVVIDNGDSPSLAYVSSVTRADDGVVSVNYSLVYDLTWGNGSSAWSSGATGGWTRTVGGSPVAASFLNGDNVTFSSSTAQTVTVSGDVVVGNMSVTGDYTFSGGSIDVTGTMSAASSTISLAGNASLTFTGINNLGNVSTLTVADGSSATIKGLSGMVNSTKFDGAGTITLSEFSGTTYLGANGSDFSGKLILDNNNKVLVLGDDNQSSKNQIFASTTNYTDLQLKGTGAVTLNSGLIAGNALNIGSFEVESGITFDGKNNGSAGSPNQARYFAVHQTTETTVAGKFEHVGNDDGSNRDIGIYKYGTGNLKLTNSQNASEADLVVKGGSITLANGGTWAGKAIVANNATLAYERGTYSLTDASKYEFQTGSTLQVKDGAHVNLSVSGLALANMTVGAKPTVGLTVSVYQDATMSGKLSMTADSSSIGFVSGASLSIAGGAVKATANGSQSDITLADGATVSATAPLTVTSSAASAGIKFSNMNLTFDYSGETAYDFASTLSGTTNITKTGTGSVKLVEGAALKKATVSAGTLELAGAEKTTEFTLASGKISNDATLKVSGGKLTINGEVSLSDGTGAVKANGGTITLGSGGSITGDKVTVSTTKAADTPSGQSLIVDMRGDEGEGETPAATPAGATLSNVTISNGGIAVTDSTGGKTGSVSGATVSITGGDSEATKVTVSDINFDNTILSVTGTTALQGVNLTSSTVDVADGASLDLADVVMTGSSVEAGEGAKVNVGGTNSEIILTKTSAPDVTLADGIGTLALGYSKIDSTNLTLTLGKDFIDALEVKFYDTPFDTLAIDFGTALDGVNLTVNIPGGFPSEAIVSPDPLSGQVVTLKFSDTIPEPATAALSLLALAGLAARRRRK